MKVKDLFTDLKTKIFLVIDSDADNELNWKIEPTELELIPEDEETYFVKAVQVYQDKTVDCFISIVTPERIADFIIKTNKNGKIISESYDEQEIIPIPIVASECFGIYELYYSKENPEIGINILKEGLKLATNKSVVAEDLGYILRDENRIEEAIEAFLISEENQPSTEFTYSELAYLYGQLGQTEKELEYQKKYDDAGGL